MSRPGYSVFTWIEGALTERFEPDVYGTNVDVTQDEVDQLSQADIDKLIYGSKCQQTAWYCYTALLWSMKVGPLAPWTLVVLNIILKLP